MQDTTTKDLRNIIDNISTNLRKNDVAAEIHYRLKDPCSALSKMLRKAISAKELTDLIGFRIIVNKQYDCYKVWVILYKIYPINMKRIKNYIANPKNNGYRSLHVIVVYGLYDRNIEIQIRTRSMHNIAEFGTANHEKYKKTQEKKLIELLSNKRLNTAAISTKINNAYDILTSLIGLYQNLSLMSRQLKSYCYKFLNNLKRYHKIIGSIFSLV